MLKRLFIIILLSAVAVSLCVVSAEYFLKPLLKEKILDKTKESLGGEIGLSRLDVSLLRGIIFLKNFKIKDPKIIEYYSTASADEIVLDIDLLSLFLRRGLVFQRIYLKNFAFDFKNIKKPETNKISPPPSLSFDTEKAPHRFKSSKGTLYIKKLLIENSNFIFRDYTVIPSPTIIEITSINGGVEDLWIPLHKSGILKGAVHISGELNTKEEGILRIDGSFAKFGDDINFDVDANLERVNLIRFSPYYSNTSFNILKEAKLDIASKAVCLKNRINASQNARLYNIALHNVELAEETMLFGLPAKTVIEFFNNLKGDIRFSFNIVGTLDDPKFDPGPIVKQVLSNALRDKIISKLEGLPQEVIKMGEKALNENLNIDENLKVLEDKFGGKIEDIKKGLKKIIDYKP